MICIRNIHCPGGISPSSPACSKRLHGIGGWPGKSSIPSGLPTSFPGPHTEHDPYGCKRADESSTREESDCDNDGAEETTVIGEREVGAGDSGAEVRYM